MKSEADRGRSAYRLSFHSSSSTLVPEKGSSTVALETGRSGRSGSPSSKRQLEAEGHIRGTAALISQQPASDLASASVDGPFDLCFHSSSGAVVPEKGS